MLVTSNDADEPQDLEAETNKCCEEFDPMSPISSYNWFFFCLCPQIATMIVCTCMTLPVDVLDVFTPISARGAMLLGRYVSKGSP